MTILTAAQQELIRTRPQMTRLYMSIFQPQVVMKCLVNNVSATKGDRTIPYDTVSTGSYTSVEANFTMWVGTTDGGNDLGKIRIRSATASQFVVSENSDIAWRDNAYLTIFKYVELWPIFPRIIQDPSNIEDTIWYKDYDIAYTNQNSILGTYINMGPNRATLLDPASNQAQLYYSSTGTYNLLGNSLNYNWTFEGGSPSTSSSANPGYVTYNSAGNYVTRLQISGSNGCVDTAYRYVRVHSQADPPILKWQMLSMNGSRDEGGYNASFKVFQTIPIDGNAVVVLFSDNWYGTNHQSFGGNYPNGSNIFWTGYIDKNSIAYDYEHSEMTFEAYSVTQMMKNSSGFSISVESKASPSKWYELLDMDSKRAIYHYLRWHTTALSIADFQFVGNDYKIQFFDSDRESMYDAIDNYMRETLFGKVVTDRQGKVWMEVGAEAYSTPLSSFPSTFSISRRDWRNEPVIDERLSDEVAFIELGGIAYSGTATGTFSAFLSSAPGNAPGFRGNVESPHEGLALLSQAQLNQMAGSIFANLNAPFPKVSMELANNFTNFDIAPQEGVQVVINSADTVRNLAINGLYIPDGIDWSYYPQDSLMLPRVEFKQLVNGTDGDVITVPDPQDVGGGFSVPGLQIPPLPPLSFPGFAVGASPTGTSCCDALAILTRSCCCQVTKSLLITTAGSSTLGPVSSYNYNTNPNMYRGDEKVLFICSGTANTNYTITVEADYADSSNNTGYGTPNGGQLIVQLLNSSGGAVASGLNVQVNAVYQGSGHGSATQNITDSHFVPSYYLRLMAAGGTDIPGRGGAGIVATQWTNIVFTVCANMP
jgi:hypothetical protein